MRELTVYEERAAEIANGPDVLFVRPMYRYTGGVEPLYAVQLPDDIGRFALVVEGTGSVVRFKYRGRWCPVRSDCWMQQKDIEKDPAEAYCISTCALAETLRKHNVKEIPWEKWKRKRR